MVRVGRREEEDAGVPGTEVDQQLLLEERPTWRIG